MALFPAFASSLSTRRFAFVRSDEAGGLAWKMAENGEGTEGSLVGGLFTEEVVPGRRGRPDVVRRSLKPEVLMEGNETEVFRALGMAEGLLNWREFEEAEERWDGAFVRSS